MSRQGGIVVIYLEDNTTHFDTLKEALAGKGIDQVHHAPTIEVLLQLADEHSEESVFFVLDHDLFDIDFFERRTGVDAAKELIERGYDPSKMAGYSAGSKARAFRKAGVDTFVQKNASELVSWIVDKGGSFEAPTTSFE